jgi:serine phosphatase RsbU (regulator of sigma subunit)
VLDVGDRIAAYTDGITEARDASGQEFGLERVQQQVSSGGSPVDTVRATLAAVREYQPVTGTTRP